MPDFLLANAEFDRQIAILTALAQVIDVVAHQDGSQQYLVAGRELPSVPAGGQNTTTAAAIVLLAAHFEEFVRQQVEAYAEGVVGCYNDLDETFQSKLIDVYWRASVGSLTRFRPLHDSGWSVGARALLQNMLSYPVGGDLSQFVSKLLTEHDNNMRMDTITDLCGRVGIRSLTDLMSRNPALRVRPETS
jgi:hypothetical protein